MFRPLTVDRLESNKIRRSALGEATGVKGISFVFSPYTALWLPFFLRELQRPLADPARCAPFGGSGRYPRDLVGDLAQLQATDRTNSCAYVVAGSSAGSPARGDIVASLALAKAAPMLRTSARAANVAICFMILLLPFFGARQLRRL